IVYILYSHKHDKTYVGVTGNLEKRFLSHILKNDDFRKSKAKTFKNAIEIVNNLCTSLFSAEWLHIK
ncbi:MAG: GIY-YIG nuclease family protein, partial [Bacteroidales bacterium]|nr:GIY-YIG nuclease family protein [Bacteroidales bacterium]